MLWALRRAVFTFPARQTCTFPTRRLRPPSPFAPSFLVQLSQEVDHQPGPCGASAETQEQYSHQTRHGSQASPCIVVEPGHTARPQATHLSPPAHHLQPRHACAAWDRRAGAWRLPWLGPLAISCPTPWAWPALGRRVVTWQQRTATPSSNWGESGACPPLSGPRSPLPPAAHPPRPAPRSPQRTCRKPAGGSRGYQGFRRCAGRGRGRPGFHAPTRAHRRRPAGHGDARRRGGAGGDGCACGVGTGLAGRRDPCSVLTTAACGCRPPTVVAHARPRHGPCACGGGAPAGRHGLQRVRDMQHNPLPLPLCSFSQVSGKR